MKNWLFLALYPVLCISTSVWAAGSGKITGVVNFCNAGGVSGMRIYVPGRNYVLYTDAGGHFLFDRLAAGSYDLFYAIDTKVLNRNRGVSVKDDQVTDLGDIVFCYDSVSRAAEKPTTSGLATAVDNDQDGAPSSVDCDDNNAAIRPGAVELCDKIDNNCNGKVDDGVGLTEIANSLVRCEAGVFVFQSCRKGYADCDGNAQNGCETDLMVDSFNCGACNNFCGPDVCTNGSC